MWGQASTIISIITLSKGGRESERSVRGKEGGMEGRKREREREVGDRIEIDPGR